jgi:hypothetical protein
MDHLTEKKNFFVGIFFQCFIADLYGVLYTITKTKMPRDVENYRTEIYCCRREVLLAQIFNSSRFLYLTGY